MGESTLSSGFSQDRPLCNTQEALGRDALRTHVTQEAGRGGDVEERGQRGGASCTGRCVCGCWCQRPEQRGSRGPTKCCARNVAGAVARRSSLRSSCSLPFFPPALCGHGGFPFPHAGLPATGSADPVISQTFLLEALRHIPPVHFSCCSLSHTASGRGGRPEGLQLGQWQRTRDSQEGQVDMVPMIIPAGITGLQIPCWDGGREVHSGPRILISFFGVH